jgi:Xaa-Pro aminopeptidase
MSAESVDCLVAAGEPAVNHLAGYWRYFGGLSAAVIDSDGHLTLVVSFDEADGARALVDASVDVQTYGARGFGLVPDPGPLLTDAVAHLPAVAGAARLGTAGLGTLGPLSAFFDQLSVKVRGQVVDAEPHIALIRQVKDADELARISRAYELAWIAQDTVRNRARPGKSEIELFSEAQSSAQIEAAEPIAFFGDLLCGVRSAEVCAPIRVAGGARVAAGDGIVCDLAVGCRGYWGDTAETVVVGDNSDIEGVRLALLAILDRCAARLRPGVFASAVFKTMREEIREAFPGGEFPHHGGHGVGLGAYDDPHVIGDDHTSLLAGMVIALEPGVYFPERYGARVERMYVVTPEGGRDPRAAINTSTHERKR